ncbi:MAG: PKD domain-containing protein [Thermoplasmata archaeon]|nr:MAG: PKD domain-containing protein [Thermoplasmata archaeon]
MVTLTIGGCIEESSEKNKEEIEIEEDNMNKPSEEIQDSDKDIIADDEIKDDDQDSDIDTAPDDKPTDDDQDSDNDTTSDVPVVNSPPVAVLEISGTIVAGTYEIDYVFDISEDLTFSTYESFDEDGEIVKFTLSLGTGETISDTEPIDKQYKYSYPGCYRVTLKVEDDSGGTNKTYKDILLAEDVGLWAEYIISDDVYTEMYIEIDIFGDVVVDSAALTLLKTRLDQYIHKPDGITIDIIQEKSTQNPTISTEEIWATMVAYRDRYTDSDTLSLYMMYLAADHSEGGKLGGAFEATSIAVFKGSSFENIVNDKINSSEIEQALLCHEFFHLTGLVNIGYQSNYPHELLGPLKDNHCRNDQCVMYYQADTYDVSNYYSGELPTELCYFCQEDMKRYD